MKTSPISKSEHEHGQIQQMKLADIRPAPENDSIYRSIDPNDPELIDLANSIRREGIISPLIISADGYIGSGHRRYAAAKIAGLETVPCIVRQDINRTKNLDAFIRFIVAANKNRDKSFADKLHEAVININPATSYEPLLEHREQRSTIKPAAIELGSGHVRAQISAAKKPFLAAIQAAIEELKPYLPVSARQIHYVLLNNPPRVHASKTSSTYRNDGHSYKALVDLLTRARLTGNIDFDAIADETRPVTLPDVHADVQSYMDVELANLLMTYRRDLLVSQPNHIEIVVEKNTVRSIIEPVAAEFCIPLTSGRGYCSLPPRKAMADRFFWSGKEKFVLLLVSDFDPDGETIASSLAESLRDDFEVSDILPIKVALTYEQVTQFDLPPGATAKAGSATRQSFVQKYGEYVYELEALPPNELQQITREKIESVLDLDAFNHEIDEEKADSVELNARHDIILDALRK